jgi:hypothetical protein
MLLLIVTSLEAAADNIAAVVLYVMCVLRFETPFYLITKHVIQHNSSPVAGSSLQGSHNET